MGNLLYLLDTASLTDSLESDIQDFYVCSSLVPVWRLVGWVVFALKIAIPILIIIFGMIDLGKAVISNDDGTIKKSAKSLGIRIAAGVVIFFIPTIVGFVLNLVGYWSSSTKAQKEFEFCKTCITTPNKCKESNAPNLNSNTATVDSDEEAYVTTINDEVIALG